MPDLSQVPTATLQAWAQQSQVPQAQSAASSSPLAQVPTAVLQQWANQAQSQQSPAPQASITPEQQSQALQFLQQNYPSQQSVGTSIQQSNVAQQPQNQNTLDRFGNSGFVSAVNSFGGALPKGVVEGVRQVGSLANDAIHYLAPDSLTKATVDPLANALDKGFKATESYLEPKNPVVQQAQQESPTSKYIGTLTGQTLGNMVAFGATTKLAMGLSSFLPEGTEAIGNTFKNIANTITQGSPTLTAIGRNAAQGALYGAAQMPNDRKTGIVGGAIVGGGLGAITGPISHKLDQMSGYVYKTIQQALDSGQNPFDENTYRAIVSNLKSGGATIRSLDLQKQIGKSVNEMIDSIRPGNYDPALAPAENIAKQAMGNLNQASQIKNALYDPINKAAVTASPQTFTNMLNTVQPRLPKSVGLPQVTLPEQATLHDMMSYRQLLDGKIAQANGQLRDHVISYEEMAPYKQLRNALQQDIQSTATQAGLGEQLAKADQFYHDKYLPFSIYNKNIGQLLDDPQAATDIWKTISRQLNVPRSPNISMLNKVAQTLGPEGRETVGYATIDNAFRRAYVGEQFNPTTFASNISKMQKLGLDKEFFTPEQQSVILGLKRATINAPKILKQSEPGETGLTLLNAAPKAIQSLMHTRAGITAIKALGDLPSGVKSTVFDKTINSFVHDLLIPVIKRGFFKHAVQTGLEGQVLNAAVQPASALPDVGTLKSMIPQPPQQAIPQPIPRMINQPIQQEAIPSGILPQAD